MIPGQIDIDPNDLKGKFIVLEGADGYGKTTLAANLAKLLIDLGVDVHSTRQPYGNHPNVEPFGQLTRFKEQTKLARWLTHAAAHAQQYEYEILPALRAGKTVICDRFWWSALAYNLQGDGLIWHMSEDTLYGIEYLACQGRFPDLILLVSGKSFRPEFEDRQSFNERVVSAYEGLLDSWHLPCANISNIEVDDPDLKEEMGEHGAMMVNEEDLRHLTEGEMAIEALRVVEAAFGRKVG